MVAEKRTLLFVVPYHRDNETDNSAGKCHQRNINLKNPEEYSRIRGCISLSFLVSPILTKVILGKRYV